MAGIEIGYNRARCSDCKKEAYLNETGHYTVPPANSGGCGAKWTYASVLYTFPYEAGSKAEIVERLVERWPALASIPMGSVGCMGGPLPYGNWYIIREKRNGEFSKGSKAQAEAVSDVSE